MKGTPVLAWLALFCATVSAGSRSTPKKQIGIASWYGKKFQGKEMANGKPFDRNALTAASRTYPLGTILRITFPRTGASVWVTVTDRGPWIKGRVLDMSERAARLLGLKPYGIGAVVIEPMS